MNGLSGEIQNRFPIEEFTQEKKLPLPYQGLLDRNWVAQHGHLAKGLITKLEAHSLTYELAIEISHHASAILSNDHFAKLVIKCGDHCQVYSVPKLILSSLVPHFQGSSFTLEVEAGFFSALSEEPTLSSSSYQHLILFAKLIDNPELEKKAKAAFLDHTGLEISVATLNSVDLVIKTAASIGYLETVPKEWNFHLKPDKSSSIEFVSVAERYKGQVKSISFTGNIEDCHVQKVIENCFLLEELTLSSGKITNAAFKGISTLSRLTSLRLESCDLSDLDLSGCPHLTQLSIRSCSKLKKLIGFNHLANLRSLTIETSNELEPLNFSPLFKLSSLNLMGCWQYASLNLSPLVELTHLDLSCCWGLKEVNGLNHLRKLTSLNLDRCTNLERIEIGSLRNLASLNLSGCKNMKDFSFLKFLDKLLELDLSNCWEMRELPDLSRLVHLVSLSFRGSWHLSTLVLNLKNLTALDVSDCVDLSHVSLENLSVAVLDLSTLKNLKKLSLASLHNLTSLNLKRCMAIEEATVSNLNKIESVHFPEGKENMLANLFPKRVSRAAILKNIDDLLSRGKSEPASVLFTNLVAEGNFEELLFLAIDKCTHLTAFLVSQCQGDIEKILELHNISSMPLASRLKILPFLVPETVRATLSEVNAEELSKWPMEKISYEQLVSVPLLQVLNKLIYQNRHDDGYAAIKNQFMKIVPFKAFAALAWDQRYKQLVFDYLPLLPETHLAAAIPAFSDEMLIEFLRAQPIYVHAPYLKHATHSQKKKIFGKIGFTHAVPNSATT